MLTFTHLLLPKGDTQTQSSTTGQTPPGANGSSAPFQGKNESSLPASSTSDLSDGTAGPSTSFKDEAGLSLSSESSNESSSSSIAITGDTQTQSSTTGQTPPGPNGSSALSEGQNGSSLPAESTSNLSDGTTVPSASSKNETAISLSSESTFESFSSSEAITSTAALFDTSYPIDSDIKPSSPSKGHTGLSVSSEGSTQSLLSFEGFTRSPSPSEGDIKYSSGSIGHTPSDTTFSSAPSEEKTGSNLTAEGTNKPFVPFDSTTVISTSSKCETGLPASYEGFTGPSPSSETITASEDITGKYIFTFLDVQCRDPSTTEIFIGTKFSDVGASGNISFPLIDIPNITFSLNPGSGETFVIPLPAVPSESELNQKVNTAVVIASDEEVVVYGHQRCQGPGNHRATAFPVRGIENLGTEYWVITHQSKGTSQVGVVATRNNTNICINGVFISTTLTLHKYETFYFGGSYDLTGTYIVADKPIFVIAGNSADTSPNSKTSDDIDSFYKCLPPVKDWGRHFTLVPFPPESQPFTAKILSSHDNCTLDYVNGTGSRVSVSLSKGEVKHFHSSNVLSINSSEGILVAQFSKDRSGYGTYGNPSMLLTPHYGDAGRNEFIFSVFRLSKNNGNETSYITIWLPPASNVLIDNENVSWNEIGEGTDGYRIVQTTLSSSGFHIIHSSKNITGVVNGIGHHKYYSYSLR
ncbi:hypothetical protein HOLleu_43652 [Holothuria leucospilota]|uniref:IgGFc-binding protein N-terminal domain-containing protein n=1 Tax=Holothuria leucospilota TaxID=206669 RepID=A0A9Q0YBD3_HOLLE|nr:hypothetical protein HOLleu_43652 [Holothuria leucospilota]